jgi:hypothetical protein
MLRQQLIILNRQVNRPHLKNSERIRLVSLARFTNFWQQALHIIQPDTLLCWHRELFRIYWRRKPKNIQHKPHINPKTIALIKQIAQVNRLWGAERIRGELLKLGIKVSKRTIQRYMPKKRKKSNQTWATFLKNHASEIWACDFTVVHDLFFRPTYIFIIIELHTRRILHTAATLAPTDAWTAQRLREVTPWGKGTQISAARSRSQVWSQIRGRGSRLGSQRIMVSNSSPQGEFNLRTHHWQSETRMSGSYAHLSSFSSPPGSQGIHCVLQSGSTSPRYSATHSGALCSIAALNGELFSSKHHFKTSSWRAPSPLPLHSQVELKPAVVIGYKKRKPPA